MSDNKEFQKTVKLFLKVLSIRPLGIKTNEHSQENYSLINPVEIAMKKFEHHPSINLMNKNITNNETFHFSPADHENILKEIFKKKDKIFVENYRPVSVLLTVSKIFQRILQKKIRTNNAKENYCLHRKTSLSISL